MENCNLTEVLAAGADCYRGIWIGLGLTFFIGVCILFSLLGCYWERILDRLRKGRRRSQSDNPDCSEVAVERSNEVTPPLLRVISPMNQVSVNGDYELVPDERPGGMPLWRKRDSDRWIYSGDDGRWYIGGVSSRDQRFVCSLGYIYNDRIHEGTLPHQLHGPWEWGNSAGWHKDPTISVVLHPSAYRGGARPSAGEPGDERCGGLGVIPDHYALTYDLPSPSSRVLRAVPRGGKRDCLSEASTDDGGAARSAVESSDGSSSINRPGQDDLLPPPVAAPGRLVQILDEPGAETRREPPPEEPPRLLSVASPHGQKDCAGEYMLVERMRPNGQPVWRQQNGEHWLYSGTTARWCIGGQDVKDDAFARSAGWISQTVPHEGQMPDKVFAAWQRWDAGQNMFVKDDGIAVVGRSQLDLGIVV